MQWKERVPRYPLEHSRSTPSSAILGTLYFMSFLCHFQAMGHVWTWSWRYKRPSSFAMYLLRWNSIKFCAKWSEEPLKFNISRGIICLMEWIKWIEICMQNSKIHCWTVSILHYRTTLGNNRWCANRNQNSIVDQNGIAGESRFRIHYTPTHNAGGIPINNYTQGDKGQPFLIDSVTLLICFTTIEEIRLNCEVAVYGGVRMLCCNGTLVY